MPVCDEVVEVRPADLSRVHHDARSYPSASTHDATPAVFSSRLTAVSLWAEVMPEKPHNRSRTPFRVIRQEEVAGTGNDLEPSVGDA